MEKQFGDFEEVKDQQNPQREPEQQIRARMPRQHQLIGVIVQRYGGNRMEVLATDGKTRNCRVPGRYKRRLWLRPKDYIIIEPWPDDDEKGDIIYKYHSSELNQLRKKGLLDSLKVDF